MGCPLPARLRRDLSPVLPAARPWRDPSEVWSSSPALSLPLSPGRTLALHHSSSLPLFSSCLCSPVTRLIACCVWGCPWTPLPVPAEGTAYAGSPSAANPATQHPLSTTHPTITPKHPPTPRECARRAFGKRATGRAPDADSSILLVRRGRERNDAMDAGPPHVSCCESPRTTGGPPPR